MLPNSLAVITPISPKLRPSISSAASLQKTRDPPSSMRNIGVARLAASSRARMSGKLRGPPPEPSEVTGAG